ncbi:MAG: BatA domain-containing protein [Flavobacteriaceae bacterium]|nr:BatA domain-containing protein [Flavobacteriaceae bacterium]
MQFNHPYILYALFALLIPILVHLFQLRRFEKVPFTNVQFLKEVIIQTRKSSQLKKWLILCTRLLLLACIIIAFTEPYFADFDVKKSTRETVIYVDNSFSMQAKGKSGELFRRAIQDIIQNFPDDETLTLFTNNRTFKNTTVRAIKNKLLELEYSANQLQYKSVLLKGKDLFSKNQDSRKNLIVISDFQQKKEYLSIASEKEYTLNLIQLRPESSNNISIDSVFIKDEDATTIVLAVRTKNPEKITSSLSLFNGSELIGKASIGEKELLEFKLNKADQLNGKLALDDNSLQFDNEYFFNINKPEKINIMAINDEDDEFLKSIFTEKEFNFSSYPSDQVDYNQIASQNLIVLNEITTLPLSLTNVLKEYLKKGVTVLVIPSEKPNLSSYNSLVNSFGTPIETETRITAINFSHPIFKGVFERQVNNFQFPKVNTFIDITDYDSKVVSLENGKPFITKNGNAYLFSAAINDHNSNFKNSPLIVPILYNIALSSYQLPKMHYVIGEENTIEVRANLTNDGVLEIKNETESFIPLQQSRNDRVSMTVSDLPKNAGVFTITNGEDALQNLSFNHNREESRLRFHELNDLENDNIKVSNEVNLVLEELNSKNQIHALWKWFVIFALIFLIVELLLLKYLK